MAIIRNTYDMGVWPLRSAGAGVSGSVGNERKRVKLGTCERHDEHSSGRPIE